MAQPLFDAMIFDCDGVLIDTERLTNRIWQRKLAELGLHLENHELHHHFTGHTTAANLTRAVELLGKPLPDNFHQEMRDDFWEEVNRDLPLIPYVIDVLDTLTQIRKLPLAMATNAAREDMEFKLERTGIGRYFRHTVCVEDVNHPKPAPDIYLFAANKLRVTPNRCAVIEDSPAGIKAATEAGMRVFAYSADMVAEKQLAAGAIATFDDMRELMPLLQRQSVEA